jgi:hypothetical protein
MAGKSKKPREDEELKKKKTDEDELDEDAVIDPLKEPEELLDEEEDEWMDGLDEEESY